MTLTVLFIDTNVLLHFQRLADIDWPALVEADSVRILFPPVVFRELNKHKDRGDSAKIRSRARGVLSDLEAMLENGPDIQMRPNVEIEILPNEPALDFSKHNLAPEISDDQLLASIVDFIARNGECDCRLVTDDLGLRLKAKSRQIKTLKLSEKLRLPNDRDASEKKISVLEDEILRLKQTQPILRLTFADGSNCSKITLAPYSGDTERAVSEGLSEIREKYPKLRRKRSNITPDDTLRTHALREMLGRSLDVPNEEIDAYNQELEEFYTEYQGFLEAVERFKQQLNLTVRSSIVVSNEGRCPAEGVELEVHFPDGFLLFSDENKPVSPEPPDAPEKPMSQAEKMHRTMEDFRVPLREMNSGGLLAMPPISNRNVSKPNIRQSQSYDVRYSIKKVKHGFREQLDDLLIVFASLREAASFEVTYKLHAENLSEPVLGKLHWIVGPQTEPFTV